LADLDHSATVNCPARNPLVPAALRSSLLHNRDVDLYASWHRARRSWM